MAVYRIACELSDHTGEVRCVQATDYPHSGIVSAGSDITSRLWFPCRRKTGFMEGHIFSGHEGKVNAVCSIPATTDHPLGLIATGCVDGKINIYSLNCLLPIHELEGHTESVNSLCSIKSGHFLSGSSDSTAKLWKGKLNIMTFRGHNLDVLCAGLSPNGEMMVTGSLDGSIKIWNKNGKCERSLEAHTDAVTGLTVADDAEFWSCSRDKTVKKWKFDGSCIKVQSDPNAINCLALFPQTENVVFITGDLSIKLWISGQNPQTIAVCPVKSSSICVLPNGSIITGGSDHKIRVYSCEPNRGGLLTDGVLQPKSNSLLVDSGVRSQTQSPIAVAGHNRGVNVIKDQESRDSSLYKGSASSNTSSAANSPPSSMSSIRSSKANSLMLRSTQPQVLRDKAADYSDKAKGSEDFIAPNGYYPQRSAFSFRKPNTNPQTAIAKLIEINTRLNVGAKMDETQLAGLVALWNETARPDPALLQLLLKILTLWSDDAIFPALDTLRAVVCNEYAVKTLFHDPGTKESIVELLYSKVNASQKPANIYLSLQVFSNLSLYPIGQDVLLEGEDTILPLLTKVCRSPNKQVQIAVATVILNLSVILPSGREEENTMLLKNAHACALQVKNSEARFRLCVAVGTLAYNDLRNRRIARSLNFKQVFIRWETDAEEKTDKLLSCLKLLVNDLA